MTDRDPRPDVATGREHAEAGEGTVSFERRHRALSRQFDALLNAIPDTLVLISPDLRVLWANRAAAARLGVKSHELVGRRCHEIWHCSETPCSICPVQASYLFGGAEAREVTDPHGSLWDLRAVPVLGEDGAVTGVIELARDITAHRHLEERLATAQKLEAVGRLAGGIAHDFNNYLAAIDGFVEVALADLPEGAAARAPLTQALAAVQAAGELARQLLAISRRQAPTCKPTDIAALLASRAGMLRQLLGDAATLEVLSAPDLGLARVDPAHVERILVNLVVNAREAMPGSGTVVIEAANRRVQGGIDDAAGEAAPGHYVSLSVRDTGTGMSKETLGRLFEPFFTTKPSGTGLGLATVYGLAHAMGGAVLVETQSGVGTRVEVLLPREETS